MENFELTSFGVDEMLPNDIRESRGGLLPLALVLFIDVGALGFMGGYLYESFTSDH